MSQNFVHDLLKRIGILAETFKKGSEEEMVTQMASIGDYTNLLTQKEIYKTSPETCLEITLCVA